MKRTYLLDRVVEKKRTHREAMRLALIEQIRRALEELSETIPFKEAYLFGTVVKPYRFFETSDVDLAFRGLRDEDFFKTMAYFSRRLERDVDVVQIERHRLRDKIMSEGIRWTKQS